MDIFIDESGSFANAKKSGSWNAVIAYVLPETEEQNAKAILGKLKKRYETSSEDEIKLNDLTEEDYFIFLQNLNTLNGVLFAVATDAGLNELDVIVQHKEHQCKSLLSNLDKMKYKGGRDGVKYLAEQLVNLSPQLYVQLQSQVSLIFNTVKRVIPYFVQRQPYTLKRFSWRIDQKNTSKIDFEDAFEKITPALIQTRSLYTGPQ